MVYVLIVIVLGSGSAVSGIEFNNREACEAAAKAVEDKPMQSINRVASVVCSPKGIYHPEDPR